MTLSTELFETIACPLCGSTDSAVVRASEYREGITAAELKQFYSASSAHVLSDQVVRCASCTLVYVNPRPDPDLIISSYSDAEDPTFVEQNDDRIKTFRRTIRRILSSIGKPSGKGMRLLDVGCAGGAFPVAARDAGFQASGVEPSRWMAEFGRKTYQLDIVDGILAPGMFEPNTFDVITLWDVIEHVPDPHALLTLIHSLLKPDGWLVVNYPDVGTVAAKVLGRRWPFWLSVHLLYYTRRTMGQQLTRAGFAPKSFETFWPTLPLGYVVQRAAAYIRPLSVFQRILKSIGLGAVPCTYNMGQTLVVSKKVVSGKTGEASPIAARN